jgi:adenine-specific DNA methylase
MSSLKQLVDKIAPRERGAGAPPHARLYPSFARMSLTAARYVLLTTLLGDPHLVESAIRLEGNRLPYWHNPPAEVKERLRGVVVLDPFAGGGSIPLEAARLGAHAVALEYNPVQWLALKTIQLARERGKDLIDPRAWEALKKRYRRGFGADMEAICKSGEAEKAGPLAREGCRIALELEAELSRYYPPRGGRRVTHYIWAKQVRCHKCGAWVPLVMSSVLDRKRGVSWKPVYSGGDYDVVVERGGEAVRTVSRGTATCLVCGYKIKKKEVRESVGHNDKMVVVVTEDKKFHPADEADRKAYEEVPVPERLTEQLSPLDPRTVRPPVYGWTRYGDLFNKRQHVYLNRLVERLKQLEPDIRTVLAWLVARQADYNSRMTSWDANKLGVMHTTSFKSVRVSYDYVEVNPFARGASSLWNALYDAINGFAFLVHAMEEAGPFEPVFGSALRLPFPDSSIRYVVTDPPYFDSIPYSESYDFYYVWLKRVVGDLYPEAFSYWTLWRDRSAEDISVGGGRTAEHFRTFLKRAFREIRRVLADDGVFVVFYAHPKREAWVALAEAVTGAGFTVEDVYPLRMWMETDVHARGKDAITVAYVFIMRPKTQQSPAPNSLEAEVEKALEQMVAAYRGNDLKMGAYAAAVKVAAHMDAVDAVEKAEHIFSHLQAQTSMSPSVSP